MSRTTHSTSTPTDHRYTNNDTILSIITSTRRRTTNDYTRRLLTTPPPLPQPTTGESIIRSCWSISTIRSTHRHLIPSARTTNTSSCLMIPATSSIPSFTFRSHSSSHPRHRYRNFIAWSGPSTIPAGVTFLRDAITRKLFYTHSATG